MGKFDGVLLVSDYDDTLFNTLATVSRENKDAINYFMTNGGRFTIATGRAHMTFVHQMENEVIPLNAPCILFNGAAVYDFKKGEYLYKTFLPETSPRDVGELLTAYPGIGAVVYHDDKMYITNANASTDMYLSRVTVMADGILDIDEIPVPWFKAVLLQDTPMLLEAQRYIRERHSGEYEAIFSNPYILEFTRTGSTKGGMVLRLAEHYGISREHIYCIGDNQNDISMLEIAAIGFAPQNCADAVRESGARIVRHCDDHAIADVISILDKMY